MSLIPDVRFQIVKFANEAVATATENAVHHVPDVWEYAEVRPIPVAWPGYKGVKTVKGDCGWFVKCTYWRAGGRDPMDTDFGTWGDTETLFEKGKSILNRQTHVGDVVLFGPDGETHAAIIVKTGEDALTASFGAIGTPQHATVSELVGGIQYVGLNPYPIHYMRYSTVNRKLSLKSLVSRLRYVK